MDKFHFISYSTTGEAQGFTQQLALDLQGGAPPFSIWIDKNGIDPGRDWDTQIAEAIRDCASLIFVMTPDSVEDHSVCKNEWLWALKYKKPIVPIRLRRDAEMPFRLGARQCIDFTGDREPALARLRKHLLWLKSPAGELQALKDRLADAHRDERRASDEERPRITDEIEQLKKQIAEQQRIVDNPQAAAQQTERSIQAGLERERQPEKPIGGAARSKFINPPPDIAPTFFQDRAVETELIGEFLKDAACRVLTINGRAGIGKTAMACRLLKALESGHLPDDLGTLSVDGIVYLSAKGSHRINTPNLYADLSKLLPADKAQALEALYKDAKISTEAKLHALLAEFPQGRTVVLLDNFEDLIDPETLGIADAELDEALRALLNAPQHSVKVIVTTRIGPRDLLLIRADRQMQIHLDEGLESPHAENILRAMDADGKVGLKTAPDEVLNRARLYTRGYPRALVALYGILSADRYTTLEEVLSNPPPKDVVEALVGEAFSRLDPTAQNVMEALAVYERPVTPAAIDYLLQPYLPGINSAPVLNRLVNMQFVRKEGNRYYQHAVDRAYALSRIPRGEKSDRPAHNSMDWLFESFLKQTDSTDEPKSAVTTPPLLNSIQERGPGGEVYTQYDLLHRGAEYFKQARQPRETWKKLDDLTPQLNEFELRYAGEDYDTAASVLLEIGFDYLLLWGQYRLMIDLYERLQGKVNDAELQFRSLNHLGLAYHAIGQIKNAISYYDQALTMVRDAKRRQAEGALLGNLGSCYADLGQTARAIEYCEQALAIAREIGDRRSEGAWLGNLGSGYARLGQTARAIEYHEQALAIDREIGDRRGEGTDLGNLGNRYVELGRTARAIEYYEQALAIRREIGDRRGEGNDLGNLGICYAELGQTARAIEYYEQALAIAHEIRDRRGEGNRLGNLGICYADLGQTACAIEYQEQALAIAREIGDRRSEGTDLGNLGNRYAALGQTARAIESYEQALAIAREIGDRRGEGYDLGNLAEALVDAGRYTEAIQRAQDSVKIGKEIGNPAIGCYHNRSLALAYLCANELPAARVAAEAARKWDAPLSNHGARVLLGVIALRQKDLLAAKAAFTEAATSADEQLAQSAQNYAALDSKGLALCGLALCGDDARVNDAIAAYRAARAINQDAGIVKRVLRLFDALAVVDQDGILRDVRSAAAGEVRQ